MSPTRAASGAGEGESLVGDNGPTAVQPAAPAGWPPGPPPAHAGAGVRSSPGWPRRGGGDRDRARRTSDLEAPIARRASPRGRSWPSPRSASWPRISASTSPCPGPAGGPGHLPRGRRAAAGTVGDRSTLPSSQSSAEDEDSDGRRHKTREPVKGVRKMMASAMAQRAFTAPHVTEWITIDTTAHHGAGRAAQGATRVPRRQGLAPSGRWRRRCPGDAAHPADQLLLGRGGAEVVSRATSTSASRPRPREAWSCPTSRTPRTLAPAWPTALGELTAVAREGKTQPAEMAAGRSRRRCGRLRCQRRYADHQPRRVRDPLFVGSESSPGWSPRGHG